VGRNRSVAAREKAGFRRENSRKSTGFRAFFIDYCGF
jgi:hypothetical protein